MKKPEIKLVPIGVPVGSLVIPPDEIKKVFRKAFNAGIKCCQLHPDDSTYDTIHFNGALEKIMKPYNKIKPQ